MNVVPNTPTTISTPSASSSPSDATLGEEMRHGSGVVRPRDITLVRGEGTRVWDDQGRDYLDFTAGYGTASLGHAHPAIVAAVADQAARLTASPTIFGNGVRAALLRDLSDVTPAGVDRFFLCNSGTEAVEAALKFARLVTGRTGVVAARRGFHGRTFGSMSATSDPRHRAMFAPLVPGFLHVPYDDEKALRSAVDDSIGAVILEVVQGEGGLHLASRRYLESVRRLTRERGALFVLDEVQTGFGRTGRMFACEHAEVVPDLMCLAKGMGGGLPIGAVAMGEAVGELPRGSHGSTFGGGPVACAAARAVLRVLRDDDLPARGLRSGRRFMERLQAIDAPVVREVRGRGLMIGVDLRERVQPYLRRLQEKGVLALPAGATVMRFLPPLTVCDDELDQAAEVVERVLCEAPRGGRVSKTSAAMEERS